MISVELVSVPERAGETRPRRHHSLKDGDLINGFHPDVKTLWDSFIHASEKFSSLKCSPCMIYPLKGILDCLGSRPIANGEAQDYVFESYSTIHRRVLNLAYILMYHMTNCMTT